VKVPLFPATSYAFIRCSSTGPGAFDAGTLYALLQFSLLYMYPNSVATPNVAVVCLEL